MSNIQRVFKIISTVGTTTVMPLNGSELVYSWKRKNKIQFIKELKTKLVFGNNSKTNVYDFDFFLTFEQNVNTRCQEIVCEVYNLCNGVEVLEYTGVIELIAAEWDLDKCIVNLTLQPKNDVYDCIDKNKKDTEIPVSNFNTFTAGLPDVSCDITLPDYDVAAGNMYFGTPPDKPFGLYSNVNPGEYIPVYNYGYTVCISSDGKTWTAVGNNFWEQTHYYDTIVNSKSHYIYDYPIGNEYNYITIRKLYIDSYFFIDRNTLLDEFNFEFPYYKFHVLVNYIVRELLVKCGRPFDKQMVRSDFFDWNPKGDAVGYVASIIPKLPLNLPNLYYENVFGNVTEFEKTLYTPIIPGTNYYTGEPNHLTNMLYMPKSNAKDNSASSWEEPYQLRETSPGNFTPDFNDNRITFEELENILENTFQCYWFIDTDGCMRIEHLSYFDALGITYDSTDLENNKFNVANNKYKYLKQEQPKKELFLFSTNLDVLNGRVTGNSTKYNEISYDEACTNSDANNNSTTYSVPKIVTDVRAIDSKNSGNDKTVDAYDNNGIWLCTVNFSAIAYTNHHPSSSFYQSLSIATCQSEVLKDNLVATLYTNAHLQWANLIRRYLRLNRSLEIGLNGTDYITFDSKTKKSKQQDNIKLIHCCEDGIFEPSNAVIITGLGNGEILEAELNTKTNIITIKALHD